MVRRIDVGWLTALLVAICGCSPSTQASTLSLTFDVAVYSEFTPGLPAPDRLTGSVAWTFDDADPIHSTQVTSLNLTLNGRVFTLPEVGVFTSANTSIPSDMIVIGGIYDGTFPNTLGSYGPVDGLWFGDRERVLGTVSSRCCSCVRTDSKWRI